VHPYRQNPGYTYAWRKSIRRILNFLWQAHGYLLPMLSACLPVHDESCLSIMNFVQYNSNSNSSYDNALPTK